MTWTRFMDMHSGGGLKEKWPLIYIEAPENEAVAVFYAKLGHNPNRVTCTCCGEDYSISESETLEDASAYDRNCRWQPDNPMNNRWGNGKYVEEPGDSWKPFVPFADFLAGTDIGNIEREAARIIRTDEITDAERLASVPEQGYVWVDE